MIKIFSVQIMEQSFDTLWHKKIQYSKDFRTDGDRISEIDNYFYKKLARKYHHV